MSNPAEMLGRTGNFRDEVKEKRSGGISMRSEALKTIEPPLKGEGRAVFSRHILKPRLFNQEDRHKSGSPVRPPFSFCIQHAWSPPKGARCNKNRLCKELRPKVVRHQRLSLPFNKN